MKPFLLMIFCIFMFTQVWAVEKEVGVFTNHVDLNINYDQSTYGVVLNIEVEEYNLDTLELDMVYENYVNKVISVLAGAQYEYAGLHAVLGLAYRLPHEVNINTYVRSNGVVVISLEKRFQMTEKFSFSFEAETDYKRDFGGFISGELGYSIGKQSEVGVYYRKTKIIGDSIGIGFRVQF